MEMGETQPLPIWESSVFHVFWLRRVEWFICAVIYEMCYFHTNNLELSNVSSASSNYTLQKSRNSMAHVTLSDGLAIWQLVYYVVTLICSIFVSFRHGLARSSGWIFLTIFSIIRVVGCSAQIATITATSDTAETIATILGFLGLSPLLLATLGILSRV